MMSLKDRAFYQLSTLEIAELRTFPIKVREPKKIDLRKYEHIEEAIWTLLDLAHVLYYEDICYVQHGDNPRYYYKFCELEISFAGPKFDEEYVEGYADVPEPYYSLLTQNWIKGVSTKQKKKYWAAERRIEHLLGGNTGRGRLGETFDVVYREEP
ncbi:hypothetical protein HK104_008887, partial [Borealophlyctis nickersoniae]